MKIRMSQAGRAAMARSPATQRPISNRFCTFKRHGSANDTYFYSCFVLSAKKFNEIHFACPLQTVLRPSRLGFYTRSLADFRAALMVSRVAARTGAKFCELADGVGFEPTVGVNPRRFSRPLP